MIRFTTILWLTLVACTGFAMFKVKYEVQDVEDALVRVRKQIAVDRDAIHVLNAEWSFLNQPNRLAELSRKYLNLQPLGPAQLGQPGQIETLRMRPGAPPESAGGTAASPPATGTAPPAPAPKPALPVSGTAVARMER